MIAYAYPPRLTECLARQFPHYPDCSSPHVAQAYTSCTQVECVELLTPHMLTRLYLYQMYLQLNIAVVATSLPLTSLMMCWCRVPVSRGVCEGFIHLSESDTTSTAACCLGASLQLTAQSLGSAQTGEGAHAAQWRQLADQPKPYQAAAPP